jgi:hypothetical protein
MSGQGFWGLYDNTGAGNLQHNGLCTGQSDGKLGTISCWVKRYAWTTGSFNGIYVTDAWGILLRFTSADYLHLYLENSSGTLVCRMQSSIAITDSNWHWIGVSWDSNTSREQMYIDGSDVETTVTSLITNSIIDHTEPNYSMWLPPSTHGGVSDDAKMAIAQPYAHFGASADFSDGPTLAKFYNGGFVDFGPDGSLPLGSQPNQFFYGDKSAFYNNRGTGSADTWTDAGTTVQVEGPTYNSSAFSEVFLPPPLVAGSVTTNGGATRLASADISLSALVASGSISKTAAPGAVHSALVLPAPVVAGSITRETKASSAVSLSAPIVAGNAASNPGNLESHPDWFTDPWFTDPWFGGSWFGPTAPKLAGSSIALAAPTASAAAIRHRVAEGSVAIAVPYVNGFAAVNGSSPLRIASSSLSVSALVAAGVVKRTTKVRGDVTLTVPYVAYSHTNTIYAPGSVVGVTAIPAIGASGSVKRFRTHSVSGGVSLPALRVAAFTDGLGTGSGSGGDVTGVSCGIGVGI